VQPGAFLCPHCQTGLQVQRSLLPADGGHGRCPECSEAVWVPALAPAPAQTSTAVPADAGSPNSTSAVENEALDATSHVLGDDVQETAAPQSFLERYEAARSRSDADTANRQEGTAGGPRGPALVLGGLLGAGVAVGFIQGGVWVPLELPWHASFAYANLISWAGFSGVGGALLGLLLGGKRRS
jgi:predicted Zn finger-like uncharacterized protein